MAILRLDRQLDAYGPYFKDKMAILHNKIITGIITSIFACAAAVYLHVGMYYPPSDKWQMNTLCSLHDKIIIPSYKMRYGANYIVWAGSCLWCSTIITRDQDQRGKDYNGNGADPKD
jgi:hypothetical protein